MGGLWALLGFSTLSHTIRYNLLRAILSDNIVTDREARPKNLPINRDRTYQKVT
jgi:hypothetical protein